MRSSSIPLSLSLRLVEAMLPEQEILVSCETARRHTLYSS